jgi:hypothetical protein
MTDRLRPAVSLLVILGLALLAWLMVGALAMAILR